ncbi:MAG: carboxypeptidase regulatory-like domain-containing protein, partial [Blastocatellia bacterium]
MSAFSQRGLRLVSLILPLCLMMMSATGLAQSSVAGAISGSVTDPSGALVPNATITIRNLGTNREETNVTSANGAYRISNLQPGIYSLSVSATGFSEYKQDRITVEVGRITEVSPHLSVGGAAVSVDIVADGSLVNTESKEFASNINQTSINELPINGRRWSNFAILTPGSVPDGSFGLISFRGISGLLNNNTIDGGDNNQAFFSEERGRTRISYSVSQSAIREFQVNTSNYSAEYGRAAGGVTNAVTKSGTNELHGDGFYYQRNNEWGARNPLSFQSVLVNGAATQVGIKPEDVRHQFGGTIGGPVVKDKLFFFFSYDQQKRNFPGLGIFT